MGFSHPEKMGGESSCAVMIDEYDHGLPVRGPLTLAAHYRVGASHPPSPTSILGASFVGRAGPPSNK